MTRSPLTALIADVVFPMHERLKGHDSVARLRQLERTQWLSPDEIAAASLSRLRAFMGEIGTSVAYYRDLFRAHAFDPSRIASLDALARLPFLTKAKIRAAGDAMRSSSPSASTLRRYNTGGSSGDPLVFSIGAERRSHDVAAKWRATRWWGVDIGDPEIVIWGSPIEVGAQDRLRRLRDRMLRTTLLPAFEMSESNLDGFLDVMRRVKPRMLFGYPSALAHIARHAEDRDVRLDDIGLRVAFVTSERLYDHQRERIARVFGCPVANGYGARDAGFIAHECPAGRMHISAEDVIVEIVDPQGGPLAPGKIGEIVITHLATAAFPFVRYRTGDVATLDPEPCSCGRGLPVLADLQGRTTDFVVAQDGTVMHGLALIYAVRDLPGVEEFKIIQHDLGNTEVQVVATAAFLPEHERQMVLDMKSRLGQATDIRLVKVPAIAPEASGKHRYVVSHVEAGTRRPRVARSQADATSP